MGKKAKSSRKGKKAWRANISTADIEDFYEKSTKDALSGGSHASAPNEALFYVDKSKDLSVKRKIEKHREKILYCDSVLQKNQFIQPVPCPKMKISKKKHTEISQSKVPPQDVSKGDSFSDPATVDPWEEDGYEGEDKSKIKGSKPSIIPAVEVDPPGCSFNPSFESHQDALARAVADEMQKVYQHELGPEPVPLTVPGAPIGEEDMLFLDADDPVDEGYDSDVCGDCEGAEEKRSVQKKVTRVELNKRARRKEQLRKETDEKRKEELSQQIDSLPDIIQEIAKEDEEKERRHLRRVVAKQERLKSRPPRLGKHKFVPPPIQVLLSEEKDGSLRKLKGSCTLIVDRYKSFQKRGLIAPTAKRRK